jgi:predicted small lipoprotein YifL
MNGCVRMACAAIPLVALLSGCGKTGALYLPERSGEVVTRPAPAPAEGETAQSPNSPQTVDSPTSPANPAPEVTPPASTEPGKEKKKDGNSPPPPSKND